MMVLVDTPIWSLALRRAHHDLAPVQEQQVRILQELISEGRVQLLGVVRQELLSGIRYRRTVRSPSGTSALFFGRPTRPRGLRASRRDEQCLPCDGLKW